MRRILKGIANSLVFGFITIVFAITAGFILHAMSDPDIRATSDMLAYVFAVISPLATVMAAALTFVTFREGYSDPPTEEEEDTKVTVLDDPPSERSYN